MLQLQTFSRSLLLQQTLDDLLWHIAGMAGQVFGFEDCVVYLLEPQGLVQCAAYGVKSPAMREIRNRIVLPLGCGIVGSVAAAGRSERIGDTRSDPRYVTDEFEGRSELAVPISYGGRVLGVLDCESAVPDGFTAADQATLELVATLVAPRIASALAERGMAAAEQALQRAEARQRERERQQQTERLESLGQLAGGIAHDFNNLLTAILGNVALARTKGPPGEVADMLDDAAAACDRGRGLTRQLLTFASGGAPVRSVADLGELLRTVATATAAGTGLSISFELPDEPLRASFDREQLKHVVHHLVANAADAQQGGGRLRIAAGHRTTGDHAGLEVRFHDEGPGVPPSLHGRIFDPYFTTKPDGTGLGLSTSFWIARRHGGSLELDPGVARGACFVLRLPAAREARPLPRLAGELPVPTRLRALVMDDDAAVRQVMVRMLQHLGHEVVAVADGVSCVREFTAARAVGRPFDVLLLDLTLPGGMDGAETLAAVRLVDAATPAIVVSGYHETDVLAEPGAHGFQGRLEKPFTSRALRDSLAAVMRRGG